MRRARRLRRWRRLLPLHAGHAEPGPVGFLHLLQKDGSLATYRIEATGHLEFALTQRVGDAHAVAADPAAGYVYLAYGPRDRAASKHEDAYIVLHEVDPSGRLVALSTASSRPWEPDAFGTACWGEGWTWLSASRGRVWGLWTSRYASFCHHTLYTSVSHAVTSDGQLGAAAIGDGWDDFGEAVVDAGADVLYKSRMASVGALTFTSSDRTAG